MDVLHTGAWTAKAIEELKKIADGTGWRLRPKRDKFTRVPRKR